MKNEILDPEEERWRRKYPKFPGVKKCVELLKSPNVRGIWIDLICQELEEYSSECAQELIDTTKKEVESQTVIGRILLNVLVDSKLDSALSFFEEMLQSDDPLLAEYGKKGLANLDTKESRRILWENSKH